MRILIAAALLVVFGSACHGQPGAYKRFEKTLAIFERYGKQYDFDPLMLAAQGFQESQLNQKTSARSQQMVQQC